jgi:hypothetical protein
MNLLRRSLFVLALAATRLSRRVRSAALVALGIAAAAASFSGALGAGMVAQDEGLERALSRLPAQDQSIRATWFGAYDPGVDAAAVKALRGVSSARPLRALIFRERSFDGKVFNLGAADALSRWVRLRSGRLPHGCAVHRCEVVKVGGSGPLPDVAGLRLRLVGVGDLVSSVPFRQRTAYGRNVEETSYFTPSKRAPPFVLTDDVAGAAALPPFRLIFRSYAWILPLKPRDLHPWSLDDLGRRVDRARAELTAGTSFFEVSDPLADLEPAVSANRVTARRLLLLSGQAVTLLLAFVVLAAATARREAEATRARLARFGALRWQVALLSAAEATGVAVVATLVGWIVGLGAGTVIAEASGSPVGPVLTHSAASTVGVGLALGLAGTVAAVLLLAIHAPAIDVGRLSFGALEMAALGAVAAIALALARGATNASALAREGGAGVLLFLLPALIGFVAAVVAFRLLGPLARGLERGARRLPISGRLAALSIARDPGYAGAAAAFLLVSVGLAAFSLNYRSTLSRAQSDEARFQTPPDVVLERTSAQPPPLGSSQLKRVYRSRAKRTVPVLRLDGQVGTGPASRQLLLVGLPADAIGALPFWRDDFAHAPLHELADAVRPEQPVHLRGVRLPSGARVLRLHVQNRGDPFVLTASIASRDGTFVPIQFAPVEPGMTVLRAPLPALARGGLLVGLAFSPTLPEIHGSRPAAGTLTLGSVRAGSTRLAVDWSEWAGTGGIRLRDGGSTALLSFFLTSDRESRFRPRQSTDVRPVPVLATPALASLAGPGHVLPIRVADIPLVVRVTATVERFPSTEGEVVVGDEGTLWTALNASSPGSAQVNEVWLEGVSKGQARRLASDLEGPQFAGVKATFRSRVVSELRDDPLARAMLRTLAAIGLIAFALAVGGLGLAVAADLRDERGELADLEEQGAGPEALRRHVRLKSAAVITLGLFGGAVLAAILSVLVVGVVIVTASGVLPEPPLVLSIDWPAIAMGLGAFLSLALALVAALTWSAFRREAPR